MVRFQFRLFSGGPAVSERCRSDQSGTQREGLGHAVGGNDWWCVCLGVVVRARRRVAVVARWAERIRKLLCTNCWV